MYRDYGPGRGVVNKLITLGCTNYAAPGGAMAKPRRAAGRNFRLDNAGLRIAPVGCFERKIR
jgi:hypothetical protein